MKIPKGSFGYLKNQRMKYLTNIIVFLSISILIFLIGFITSDYDNGNYFTIVAILLFLPTALWIVRYIIFAKYKGPDKAKYLILEAAIKEKAHTGILVDLLLTNNKGIQYLPFVVVNENRLLVYTNDKQLANLDKNALDKSLKNTENYLKNIYKPKGIELNVNAYGDLEMLIKEVKTFKETETTQIHNDVIYQLLLHCM
ncbi:hypothetical protein EDC18_101309 [Natranaerovirga pectinivora]|uniref:NERD domain-containing protein n=1 Tax=Natranaerovirga pectinivora TaxID=682400 RepID=A0A4R3MR72_9FIRM|nr:hypothetical protein [Natranaerovirga pectinivora]TCT17013.1 hypothetical protein EDC18_101309 [Natranaerovirga pectinivora]